MDVYGFKNIVKEPTCSKGNPSLLDVILTGRWKRIVGSIHTNTGISDFHHFIGASTRIHIPKYEPRKVYYNSMKTFDEGQFVADLDMTPFHITTLFDDPDDALWAHNKLVLEVIESHGLINEKMLKRCQVPYINGKLRKAINVRKMLR